MEVIEKEFNKLKDNKVFALVALRGKRGDKLDLSSEGINGRVLFFHETPKTMCDCSYCREENKIELGGSERETERTLYLVVDSIFKNVCGGGCSGE